MASEEQWAELQGEEQRKALRPWIAEVSVEHPIKYMGDTYP